MYYNPHCEYVAREREQKQGTGLSVEISRSILMRIEIQPLALVGATRMTLARRREAVASPLVPLGAEGDCGQACYACRGTGWKALLGNHWELATFDWAKPSLAEPVHFHRKWSNGLHHSLHNGFAVIE